MKRRKFLKTSALTTGIGLTIPSGLVSCSNPHSHAVRYLDNVPARKAIQTFENNSLRFILFNDGSGIINDKPNGKDWTMGPVALQDEGRIEDGHVWVRETRSMQNNSQAGLLFRRPMINWHSFYMDARKGLSDNFSVKFRLKTRILYFNYPALRTLYLAWYFPHHWNLTA